MNFEWKTVVNKYGPNDECLYLGRIQVGAVRYSMRSKSDPISYDRICLLPGLGTNFKNGKCASEELAKQQLEVIVKKWFDYTGTVK